MIIYIRVLKIFSWSYSIEICSKSFEKKKLSDSMNENMSHETIYLIVEFSKKQLRLKCKDLSWLNSNYQKLPYWNLNEKQAMIRLMNILFVKIKFKRKKVLWHYSN